MAARTIKGDTPWADASREVCRIIKSKDGPLVLILGPRGTGKTQMATHAAYALLCQMQIEGFTPGRIEKATRYTTAVDLFIGIRETYGDDAKQSEREAIEQFSRPELLVIDEMHERGKTPWEDKILTNIVDRRYGHKLATILIANMTVSQAQDHLGPSIWSRSSECGALVVANWKSFRE